jgi:hypothetical protein
MTASDLLRPSPTSQLLVGTFEGKEALFAAAVEATVEDWALLRDRIVAATQAGRFDVDEPRIALMAARGSLLGLLHSLDVQPDADAAVLSDEMAERVLRMFGLT